MDPSQFTSEASGKLVVTTDEAYAFVPDPLPDSIELDARTVNLLARAENALGHLNGSTGRLVNPYLVGSPLLHREAILSSRIEGTITTPEELVLFEVGAPATRDATRTEDTREVRNYIQAMRHGLDRLRDLPICLRLIRELHRALLAGVRGDQEQPGEFRTVQNYICNRPTDPIQEARFVPPPVDDMHSALREFEAYLNSKNDLPLLVRLSLLHYQFEAIHPFRDGNGRVGRLLIPLLLCDRERLSQPLLYFSSYFERNREAYYDHLLSVSQNGNWSCWVRFFLRGVSECATEAIGAVEQLLDLRQRYHALFQSARSSALLMKLIDEFFQRPAISIGETAAVLKVTPASASYNLHKLVDAGIIVEWTGRTRDQVFVATKILAFMHDSEKPPGN